MYTPRLNKNEINKTLLHLFLSYDKNVSIPTVLVKLKKQDGHCVRRTQFIRPICLPDKAMTFPDYYCCQITGWGHMHESKCCVKKSHLLYCVSFTVLVRYVIMVLNVFISQCNISNRHQCTMSNHMFFHIGPCVLFISSH